MADGQLFTTDSWNAEFCDAMRPEEGDLQVRGKKGLDSFPNTNLEKLLVQRDIDTVVLGGFLTSCCVESTMRAAYEKGFNVITLKDCTADTSEAAYEAAVNGTFNLFSTPMTSTEFTAKHLQ